MDFYLSAALWVVFWHVVTGLGITIGYHRLLTHGSFKCPRWLERCWVTLGFCTLMGPPISWVAVHWCHHANADKELDPHSPNTGRPWWAKHSPTTGSGWWWAQWTWILVGTQLKKDIRSGKLEDTDTVPNRYDFDSPFVLRWATKKILQDQYYRRLTAGLGWTLWALTVLISFLIGGWPGMLGRLIATFTLLWCTWFVNSFCHIDGVGYRSFDTEDSSRNVWWVALLTNGEGWHNNHHASMSSARHGIKWWEFDLSWIIIRVMEKTGLAWKVQTFKNMTNSDQAAA